jgi:hypothetical protein
MQSVDAMLMLQRQMEVSAMLRVPPKDAAQLALVAKTLSELVVFIGQIGRLATHLQAPLEIFFQCLMQMGYKGHADFDKQKRDGHVPMHQAKVLNRDAASAIEPKVRDAISADQLATLVEQTATLRTLLRMKVEDGNDLSMARKALTLGDDYLSMIAKYADGDAAKTWALYDAQDEGAIHVLLSGSIEEAAAAAALPEMPTDLVKGVAQQCQQHLHNNKLPVAERQRALEVIQGWLSEAPTLPAVPLMVAMRDALGVQLDEKRSSLTRAACGIVSTIVSRVSPTVFAVPEAKAVMAQWCAVMLRQVHVTVKTIAEATDATIRDVIVATQGAALVCTPIATVLGKASQLELQRKCIGYLCLAMVVSRRDHGAKLRAVVGVVSPHFVSANTGVRRIARVFGILSQELCPELDLPKWDDRVDKAAAPEREAVVQMMAMGAAQFEVVTLKYGEASPMALLPPAGETLEDSSPIRTGVRPMVGSRLSSSSSTPSKTSPTFASTAPRKTSTTAGSSSVGEAPQPLRSRDNQMASPSATAKCAPPSLSRSIGSGSVPAKKEATDAKAPTPMSLTATLKARRLARAAEAK